MVMLAASLMAVPVFAAETEKTAVVEESGQNPVMNYIGDYGYFRATMHVEADGMEGAKVSVSWGSSAFEHSEWEMSGSFDPDTLTITYNNAVRKDVTFSEDGKTNSEKTVYENGSGKITFREGGKLSWTSDHGEVPEDAVFEFFSPTAVEEPSGNAKEESTEQVQLRHGNTETELTDGVLTIRIAATDHDDSAFSWQTWKGDKGDSSCVELINETDMEKGLAYAGSFRAIADGDDTIRLVHTNGHIADEYMEFNVKAADGKITEITGGSESLPSSGKDMIKVLGGNWEESVEGGRTMQISLAEDGGLEFTITSGSGRDGKAVFYTMTAYYDAVSETLIYWNGTEHEAQITDGSEDAGEAASKGEGKGSIRFVPHGEDNEKAGLVWFDDTFGNGQSSEFVKAK